MCDSLVIQRVTWSHACGNPEVFCSVSLLCERFSVCLMIVDFSLILHMMGDAVVSLKTKLLEKEREIADLKRKLDQMEKVQQLHSYLYTLCSDNAVVQNIMHLCAN